MININGVFYVSKENENGVYMERVNADGTPWVNAPQYTKEEQKAGITLGPAVIEVYKKPKKPWWRRLFG